MKDIMAKESSERIRRSFFEFFAGLGTVPDVV